MFLSSRFRGTLKTTIDLKGPNVKFHKMKYDGGSSDGGNCITPVETIVTKQIRQIKCAEQFKYKGR